MRAATPPVVRPYQRLDPKARADGPDGGRLMLCPPTGPERGRHGDSTRRRARFRLWRTLRLTRVVVLVSCLVALLGGILAASAWASFGTPTPPSANRSASSVGNGAPPLPVPTVNPTPCNLTGSVAMPGCTPITPAPTPPSWSPPLPTATTPPDCVPGSLLPGCQPGTTDSAGGTAPTETCAGPDCIPQPVTTSPAPGGGDSSGSGSGGGQADCSTWNPTTWGGCISNAIASFLSNLAASAVNPLLDLLGNTLLTTPDPTSIPQLAALWTNSWQLMLACYGILVMLAGLIVMAYETLHSRYSIKEIAPRIAVGFLAGTLSLFIATKAIQLANALAQAILGDGIDTASAMSSLKTMLVGNPSGGLLLILIALVLVAVILMLLIVYAARLIITVMLLIAAPLALMLHALPQTDGIARWWWRAFGAVLAIQLAQSLALLTALRVFLAPGGLDGLAFGSRPNRTGILVSLLVTVALFYLLFRIPFWLLSATKMGHGRSLTGTLLRAYVLGRAFGVLRGSSGGRGAGGGGRPRFTGGGGREPRAGSGRNRPGRWTDPEPGMLPMRLRRPRGPVSAPHPRLVGELDDPSRVMPYQRRADPGDPGLFGPRGGINPAARPPRRPTRPLIPPQPGMLPLTLRPNAPGSLSHTDPRRRSLADDLADPNRVPPYRAPAGRTDPGLISRTGRVNPPARPPRRIERPLVPPQPGMLPFTVRQPAPPPRRARRAPGREPNPAPPVPWQVPGQQALFTRGGEPTRAARRPRRTPSPTPPTTSPPTAPSAAPSASTPTSPPVPPSGQPRRPAQGDST